MIARSVSTFVQVGMASYNMALVREVAFTAECVYLYHLPRESDETPITLRGDVRLAFLDWWERQAEQSMQSYYLAFAGNEPSASWVSSDGP